MKAIRTIAAALLITVIFVSCESGSVIVSSRPVAPFYARPISPGPGYIWIDGDWYWRRGAYRYRPGHWTVPPHHRTWSPGYWQTHPRGGFSWQRGRWHR